MKHGSPSLLMLYTCWINYTANLLQYGPFFGVLGNLSATEIGNFHSGAEEKQGNVQLIVVIEIPKLYIFFINFFFKVKRTTLDHQKAEDETLFVFQHVREETILLLLNYLMNLLLTSDGRQLTTGLACWLQIAENIYNPPTDRSLPLPGWLASHRLRPNCGKIQSCRSASSLRPYHLRKP